MRDDHFDPQHLDEQINQCLGESRDQEPIAAQVIHDLEQEYLPGEHQEALQRVWQRIASHQESVSSTGSVGLAQHREHPVLFQQARQQRRKRLMQSPPTPYRRKKPSIAVLVGFAASILIIGSMLAVVTLLHGKQSSQTTYASSPTPVSNDIYTHTEDASNQASALAWSPDGRRLFVNQQFMTITYQTPSGMQINTPHNRVEAWDAITGQNYHQYDGDTANIWSSYQIHWSHDGKYIAYLSSPDVSTKGTGNETFHARIVVLDANNSQVLHTSDFITLGPGNIGIPQLSWSSDNATISFIIQNNAANAFDLISWNMFTGQQGSQPITNIPLGNPSANFFVNEDWSPDGKFIVFVINANKGSIHLFIIDAQTRQTTGDYSFNDASIGNHLLGWTADSQQFFFYSNQASDLEVNPQNTSFQVTSIDPTGQVVLESTLAGIDANKPPSYWLSPDGKYLASVNEGSNKYELDIWSLASKKIVNKYLFAEVPAPQTSGQAPPIVAWSPDEQYIATAYTDQQEKITISRIILP